ncbi:MAG: deoxynucleoside kinase [candidate division Zixibacteria bacterium]|nr:deoxynucleoside kinase [candidate division Zixibacteria bacterium]
MPGFDYIAVEGAPASGKTLLAAFLAEKLKARPALEDLQGNSFLAEFYRNPPRYSFSTQIYFLVTRYQELKQLAEPDMFAKKNVSDFTFSKDKVYARLNLNQRELALYQNLSKMMESEIPKPDLIIYLQVSAAVAQKRLGERDKKQELYSNKLYLQSLCKAFDQYFFNYNETPLLIVKANQLDFANKKSDLELILTELSKPVAGTRYFDPAPLQTLL